MKIAEMAKLVAVSMLVLVLGGCRREPKPVERSKGAFYSMSPYFRACADGTAYMLDSNQRLVWMVGDKAVRVECEDTFWAYDMESFLADAVGGLYAMGETDLWYIKDGKAAKVREVALDQIDAEEHSLTPATRLWSFLSAYGQSAYDLGQGQGFEEGLEQYRDAE